MQRKEVLIENFKDLMTEDTIKQLRAGKIVETEDKEAQKEKAIDEMQG